MKNKQGVTLVNMIIIIIVLIIIAGVSIIGGTDILKSSKESKKEENLAIVKAMVSEISLKKSTAGVFIPGSVELYGEPAKNVMGLVNKYPDISLDKWYVLENEDLQKIGIKYADEVYLVNYEDNEVKILPDYIESLPEYYFVQFDANGGIGTMENHKLAIGKKEILPLNKYTKDGFAFEGWNTLADGSGTHYDEGEEVVDLILNAGETITLYAQWGTAYTIEYIANGGEGSMESQVVKYGEYVAIKSNAFTKPGYKFVCWSTSPTSTSDSHGWTGWSGTWKYTNGRYGIENRRLKLYAVWKRAGDYVIVYDANGGIGEMEEQIVKKGDNVAIRSNTFVRENYKFVCWDVNPTSDKDTHKWTNWSGTWNFTDGQYGIRDGILRLYAIWTPTKYTIQYDANGGNGVVESHTVSMGEKVTIKSNAFTKEGYVFEGWTTRADGQNDGHGWRPGWTGTWTYVNGQFGIKNGVLKLYARWKLVE